MARHPQRRTFLIGLRPQGSILQRLPSPAAPALAFLPRLKRSLGKGEKRRWREDGGNAMDAFMGQTLAPFLLRPWTRVAIGASYLLYLVIALAGCATFRIDMSMGNLVMDTSPFKRYFPIVERHVWSDYVVVDILVRSPPNFALKSEMDDFMRFRKRFASVPAFGGWETAELWLEKYNAFLSLHDAGIVEGGSQVEGFYSAQHLSDFFLSKEGRDFGPHVRLNCAFNSTEPQSLLKSFIFKLVFHGLPTWEAKETMFNAVREIAASAPTYDAVPFTYLSSYVDQKATLAPTTLQTMALAILSMSAVTSVLLAADFVHFPRRECIQATVRTVALVTFNLVSVEAGVAGFLRLTGVTLDIISVVCILITIGLAVDFTAHICHRFEHSPCGTAKEKVADTLGKMGWPILQAGISTILGVLVLALVPAYLVSTFVKAITLVSVFGCYHGLILMPLLYSMLEPNKRLPRPQA